MRPTYLGDITEEEKNKLYAMIDDDSSNGVGYRAKIILLLRNEGYTVPEIRRKTNHDNITYVNGYTDSTVMVLMALHHQGNMVMML
jgi:hypothetical protein